MKTATNSRRMRGGGRNRLRACALSLFSLLSVGAGGAAMAAPPVEPAAGLAPHANAQYHAVPLSDDPLAFGIDINPKGQVAFTELFEQPAPGVERARFFDGKSITTLGTFGGNNSHSFALNASGQVTGYADLAYGDDPFNLFHAFRWSKELGLVDLSRPPMRSSYGTDINDKGEVVGSAVFDAASDVFHAARWNARNRAQDLGTVAGGFSAATATNEAGIVVGWAQAPQLPALRVPFRWSQADGMQSLASFASDGASAWDVNASGAIVGAAPFQQAGADHAFLWTAAGSLIDLAPGSSLGSGATHINDKGMVIGFISNFPAFGIGFVWTRESGLIEIGSLNANTSTADDVNNNGEVVGSIDGRAYLWTRGRGIVDLNTRLCHAPQGLVLRQAYAINDRGDIVAATNTGLVLLTTQAVSKLRPLVGPIQLTGTPRAGVTLSFNAGFTDADVRDTHRAVWNWGDGDIQAGTVNEKNGAGSVSGQHTFQASGEYSVQLTVTDSSGKSTTVRYELLVADDSASVAGQGWFIMQPGASRLAPPRSAIAAFSFLSPARQAQGEARIRFTAPGVRFRADRVASQASQGTRLLYQGTGTLNGTAGHHFMLDTSALSTPDGQGNRVRIRIWAGAPGAPTDSVRYDNQSPRALPAELGGMLLPPN